MTRAAHVLLVEDEPAIRSGLQDQFGREGYRVEVASDVQGALQALQRPFDLVVLDRRLPDGDGLDVLRHLRMRGDHTPVLVLSARGEADDRVTGLEDGADDYVVKPFHLRELLARMRGLLQRAASAAAPVKAARIAFGDCELDVGARQLRKGRSVVELARKEFELLLYLLQRPGQTVTRNELLDRVWGYDRFPTTRTIDYHVLALRKKVEPDPEAPRHLVTVHRVGYRFEP